MEISTVICHVLAVPNALLALRLPPSFPHPLIRLLDRLRQDARLAEDGHEIRVACPARDDVHVDVVWHARARGLADVCAHVERLRMVDIFQDDDGLGTQLHHLGARFRVQQFERGFVVNRRDHEMTVRVGEQVDDDEGAPSAMDDQVFGIVFRLCQSVAENAPVFFYMTFDVLSSPGGCHSFHAAILAEIL